MKQKPRLELCYVKIADRMTKVGLHYTITYLLLSFSYIYYLQMNVLL